ncbi:MAG: hypothetical protein GXO31_08940 [Epsilonproteobacteria bacterium]|nr:hypothetical protein [Campylobacterota bacterium]
MQTFSDMQRNSSYQRVIVKILTAGILVLYEALTSAYPFLPSLFGVFFVYLLFYFDSKLRFYEITYSFLYLTIYELDKGFYLFSFIIFFIIYYNFVKDEIKKYIFCKGCLAFFYTLTGYLGYYLINFIIAFILNDPKPILGYDNISYFTNIFIDTFLVLLIFKKKL